MLKTDKATMRELSIAETKAVSGAVSGPVKPPIVWIPLQPQPPQPDPWIA